MRKARLPKLCHKDLYLLNSDLQEMLVHNPSGNAEKCVLSTLADLYLKVAPKVFIPQDNYKVSLTYSQAAALACGYRWVKASRDPWVMATRTLLLSIIDRHLI